MKRPSPRWRRAAPKSVVTSLVLAGAIPAAFGQAAESTPTLRQVDVIQQAPLPGFDIPLDQYPGNAQQAGSTTRREAESTSLPDFVNQRLQSVYSSEVEGSPFETDVIYRGQRLSHVLGTPQGLSLYLDGVRMNQPFGDVVNWDLLPEAAIAGLTLVPGSNPLYGLNTLAGALVLTTHSGLTHPGGELGITLGSGQSKRIDFAQGKRWADGSHFFAAATAFDEQGWRENAPGHLGNVFLKYGRLQDDSDWSASLLVAGSQLTGNGLVPESLANADWRAAYTTPDVTRSTDTLFTLRGSRVLPGDRMLSGQLWLRHGTRNGSSGDVNDDWPDWLGDCAADPTTPACSDPNDPGFVGESAVFNQFRARQSEAGGAVQWNARIGAHQLTLGGELAGNSVQYDQTTQAATFDAQRNATPVPGAPEVPQVSLRGHSTRVAVFAADLWALSDRTQLSPSLRWNGVQMTNDLGNPAPATSETFRYTKLNPALGATYRASDRLTFFGSAAQGNRVPTALELGCADPATPCVLPAGLQSDPFLRQVVSRTLEAGVRGRWAEFVDWSAAVYRTDNRDDIVFVRSGVSQAGFFTNVPRTRYQGLELATQGHRAAWDWHASYSLVSATYQSSGVLQGPLSTDAQPNAFRPGTRIAGVPAQLLKLSVDWRAMPKLRLGLDWFVAADQVVSGNESGTQPELGKLGGYGVVNARARWQFQRGWEAWARVNNVFDRHYATAALGNLNLFPGGQPVQPGSLPPAERFLALGAPRTAYVGVRYAWD